MEPKNKIHYEEGEKVGECYYIRDTKSVNYRRYAEFRCRCGKTFESSITNVKGGNKTQCGCMETELRRKVHFKHGMKGTKTYYAWQNMKHRCYNKNNQDYSRYGGRGISVCAEWKHDFLAFHGYISQLDNYGLDGYTLDRIDSYGNYEIGNVRWATPHQQAANKGVRTISASSYTGVSYKKENDRYCATICINYKQVHISCHKKSIDALKARNNYIIKNKLHDYPIQQPINKTL